MPQMAPIWWFSLFMMFILTYITFMTMLYFYNIYKIENNTKSKQKNILNINWKW